jgi:hypothetical protein
MADDYWIPEGQMNWDIVGAISDQETIAEGGGIRELKRLRDWYGGRKWYKKKGVASVRFLPDGPTMQAEVHWYEAHGIGKVEMKIKALL